MKFILVKAVMPNTVVSTKISPELIGDWDDSNGTVYYALY